MIDGYKLGLKQGGMRQEVCTWGTGISRNKSGGNNSGFFGVGIFSISGYNNISARMKNFSGG